MSELYISRMNGGGDENIVRIDTRDGATLLSRTEVSIEDFAKAILGQGAVPVKFTMERDAPGYRAERR